MAVIDRISEIVELFQGGWNSSFTDGKTPNIGKITGFPKELQFDDRRGYILIYSVSEDEVHSGIGESTLADIEETIRIDIRVLKDEVYFKKIKSEVKRIIYSNINLPTTNVCTIDINNQTVNNLSDRSRLFYREVRSVVLQDFNHDMTT